MTMSTLNWRLMLVMKSGWTAVAAALLALMSTGDSNSTTANIPMQSIRVDIIKMASCNDSLPTDTVTWNILWSLVMWHLMTVESICVLRRKDREGLIIMHSTSQVFHIYFTLLKLWNFNKLHNSYQFYMLHIIQLPVDFISLGSYFITLLHYITLKNFSSGLSKKNF